MLAYLQKGGQMVIEFLRPKKKLGWISFVLLGVLLLAVVLVTTPAAYADVWDTVANMISRFCLMVATFFMKLTIFCLTFIVQIAAYNGYLDSTAVNYGWVMVRDIANMFFVVILLLIAFGTILGLEQYEWKKMMVKFVMAAILVNFSRLICGVIIDIGQVVMVTFINGVAATAGGNLITMFNLGDVMSLTGQQEINGSEVLMASVASVAFTAMALGIMVVFLVMLAGRMITLWVLIVLSPLAFVFSVVPQTQKYASDWWNQFGNNVIVGPVIAFFLWLAFVTVGSGNVNNEISGNSQTDMKIVEDSLAGAGAQTAGISSAMSWSKMANFAIAIGMLLVGAKTAQQLGTMGGNMMSKATDFAKKATMVAAGVTAGKWAYDKGIKPAAKWTAMNVPLVGGKAWGRRWDTVKGAVGNKFYDVQEWRNRLANKAAQPGADYRKKKLDLDERLKNAGRLEALDRDQKALEAEKKAAMEAGGGKLTKRQQAEFAKKEKEMKMREIEVKRTSISKDDYKKEIQELNQTYKKESGGTLGRALRYVGERAIETGSRADNKAENWRDVLEARAKSLKFHHSTSGSTSGIAKLSARVDLSFDEEMAKAKAIQKTDQLSAFRMAGAQGLIEQYGGDAKNHTKESAALAMALAQAKTEVSSFGKQVAEYGLKTAATDDKYAQAKQNAEVAQLAFSTDRTKREIAALSNGLLVNAKVDSAGMANLMQSELDRLITDERSSRSRANRLLIEEIDQGYKSALDEFNQANKAIADYDEQINTAKQLSKEAKTPKDRLYAQQQIEDYEGKKRKAVIARDEAKQRMGTSLESRRATYESFMPGKGGMVNTGIATAYSEVLKEEGAIFGANVGMLKEAVMQSAVGDPRGMNYPNTTYISMIQGMLKNFKGMDRQPMLDAFEAASDRIIRNKDKDGYKGSKEEEIDRAYLDVAYFKLNTEQFGDDTVGGKSVNKVMSDLGGLDNEKKELFRSAQNAISSLSAAGSDMMRVLDDAGHSDRGNLSTVLSELRTKLSVNNNEGLVDLMYNEQNKARLADALRETRRQSTSTAAWERMSDDKIIGLLREVASSNDRLVKDKINKV